MSQPVDSRPPEISLSFRRELVSHIFKALHGGWSCALVGVTGVGMSNLLRFVGEPWVAAHYLERPPATLLCVQPERDLGFEPARLYESIIRQIPESAKAFGWPRADVALLNDLVKSASTAGAPGVEDALGSMITYVCETKRSRVVLVCDEFDWTFAGVPATTLHGLRRLRDNHKAGLSFVVGLRREFGELFRQHHSDDARALKFAELFDQHTFPLPPYTQDDTLDVIRRKTFDWDPPLMPELQDRLYRATGGHAKLLVTSLALLPARLHLPWPDIERSLLGADAVITICHEIWSDLNVREQAGLRAVAGAQRDVSAQTLDRLRLKGLVVGGPPGVFSTLFEAFIRRGEPDAPQLTRLTDPAARVDW